MPEQEYKKRNTAFRVSIGMLMNTEPIYEQERLRAVSLNGKEIVRINLIATVVDKFTSEEKPYGSLTLDDNTGDIRVKAFADDVRLFDGITIGDSVIVVGVIRLFNEELYITPEIIKPVDARWLLARKLELAKEYGDFYESCKSYTQIPEEKQPVEDAQSIENKLIEEIKIPSDSSDVIQESLRAKIFEMIKEAEPQGGMSVEKLILSMKDPVDKINSDIQALLEDGEIFEPKPGTLRVL